MNLHPECGFVKSKLLNSLTLVVTLHNNKVFIKIPWFTENHLISFGFVVEEKKHCMVAHDMYLKTIAGTPKRSKSLGDGINVQNTLM